MLKSHQYQPGRYLDLCTACERLTDDEIAARLDNRRRDGAQT